MARHSYTQTGQIISACTVGNKHSTQVRNTAQLDLMQFCYLFTLLLCACAARTISKAIIGYSLEAGAAGFLILFVLVPRATATVRASSL